MRTVLRRARLLALAAVLGLGTVAVVGISPAYASGCTHGQAEWVFGPNGVSKANVTVYWGCPDGKDHWSGTVYDTKCDAHPGRFVIGGDAEADPVSVDEFPVARALWNYTYTAGNGCGTYTTFSGSGAAATNRITVGAGNCNWWEIGCLFGLDQIEL